jgi:heterodisulfide reductase subunit B
MKYGYFPGCSLNSTAREYDSSLRAVFEKLGIDMVEPERWVCCGSTPAHASSHLLGLSLPMYNLAVYDRLGVTDVVAPCAACFARFKTAQYEKAHDAKIAATLDKIVGYKFNGSINVRHPLEVISGESELARISRLATGKIGMKVVSYYGCLLTRPPKIMQFDEYENPQSMDRVLRAAGVQTLDWQRKTDCCGASFALTRTEIVLKLCRDLLEEAKQTGADAIAVACPLCQMNLDSREEEVEKTYGVSYQLPIFYFTQLLALAMGISREKLMFEKHLVETQNALGKAGWKWL